MLKLSVAVLAVALVGSVSADESSDLRIDASSQRAFRRSLEVAKEDLSPADVEMLGGALKHIWNEGTRVAEAEGRRYSAKDYFRQLDGLSYEEVVHFTDATYEAALQYSAASDAAARAAPSSGAANPPYRHPKSDGRFWRSPNSAYVPHGGTDLTGPGGQQ